MRGGKFGVLRSVLTVALVSTVVLSMSACAPEPEPAPEPELLTVSEAGGRYLNAICPVNDEWDAVDVEVDRLRIAVARGDHSDAGDTDTRLFVESMVSLEQAIAGAQSALNDPAIEWPRESQRAITAVLASLDSDAEQIDLVTKMDAAEIASYVWDGAERMAVSAQETRAALGLPEDSKTACGLR